MNKLVKILSVLVIAASLTAVSFAQGAGPKGGAPGKQGGPGGEHRFGRIEKILQDLNLTKDQKSKVKDLMKKTGDQLKDLHKSSGGGKGDKPTPETREKMKAIMKGFHDELFKILTPDQQKKFKEEMKKLREQNQGQGGFGRGNGPKP